MNKYLLQKETIIYLCLLEVWEELGVSLVKSITLTWLELIFWLEFKVWVDPNELIPNERWKIKIQSIFGPHKNSLSENKKNLIFEIL